MSILEKLIPTVAGRIRDHAAELTSLDQAIGDGDHGTNMRRGFDAVAEQAGELAPLALGAALQKAGMTLVMKVGGASGPLYGSLLMSTGKALGDGVDAASVVAAFGEGIEAVKKRGRSDAGQKTMLDVLIPVKAALDEALAAGQTGAELLETARRTAEAGLESTRDMKAIKGRASFLGDRSIGHLDPGARSSCLIIEAVSDVLAE